MTTKNIVLFSDGTNNKGGVGRDTNVYRLYKMLDNDDNLQYGFYDDGVGTEKSTPQKLMGLVIGKGLSQNVEDLYLSLISRHDPDAHIYLFGFSRGAFTVRMLANLIDFAGVPSDPELKRKPHTIRKWAKRALDEYKAKMQEGDGRYPADNQRCKQERTENISSEQDPGVKVEIRCIGVWDTVNATGFPINAIRERWGYRWIQDESVARLPQCVRTSFHAMAIDEERRTFSPTLWDENLLQDDQYVEQVWFAGVHSNVGGGYPKDGMAQVSLEWMLSRLDDLPQLEDGKFGKGQLRFNSRRELVSLASDINGKQYNSRAGLAAFYQYKPRDIDALTKKVTKLGAPLIHQSVLRRIENNTAFYAPYMIRQFHCLDAKTNEMSEKIEVQSKYKMPTGEDEEGDSRVDILHSVNARAILYWMFFSLIMAILWLPWVARPLSWFGEGGEVFILSCSIRSLGSFFPDFLKCWFEWYACHPFILLGLLVGLFINRKFIKPRLERRLESVAGDMWHNLSISILQKFAKEQDIEILLKKEIKQEEELEQRDLESLRKPERFIKNIERALSKRMNWRSK